MSEGTHSSEDLNSTEIAVRGSHEAFKKFTTWAYESSDDKRVKKLLSELLALLVSYCTTLRLLSDLAAGGYLTCKEILEDSSISNDEARDRVVTLTDQVGSAIVAIALDRKVMACVSDVVQDTITYLEGEKAGRLRTKDTFDKQKDCMTIAKVHIQKFAQREKERKKKRAATKIVLPIVELGVHHLHKMTTQDHNRVKTQVDQCTHTIQHLKAVLEDLDTFQKQMAAAESHWESLQQLISRISTGLAERRGVLQQPELKQDIEQLRDEFQVLKTINVDDPASSQPSHA